MEPKFEIRPCKNGRYRLVGNSAAFQGLISAIQLKLKLKDRLSATFKVDDAKLELVLQEKGNEELYGGSLDTEPTYASCHPLTPELIKNLPLRRNPRPDSYVAEVRREHRRAYEPWSKRENKLLRERFVGGLCNYQVLAYIFQRTVGGILSRLEKLGCITQQEVDMYYGRHYDRGPRSYNY